MNSILDDIDIENNHYDVVYPDINSTGNSKYYQIDKFNELKFNQNTDLLILNYNIRSLSANYDQFNGFSQLLKAKFDIINFTESWLKEGNKQLYAINDYNDFHNLRDDGRRGGGISIYISKQFEAKIIKESTITLNYIETLFIEIVKENRKILIASVYKPNRSDDHLFIEKLSHLLSTNSKNNYHDIILMGDFNFDLLKYEENNITQDFLNTMNSQSLIPVISKPTRVTDSSATLIDNIFISNPINFTSGIIITDISDHFPIFINLRSVFSRNIDDPNIKIEYRLINDNTMKNFHQTVSSIDFTDIINTEDCSTAISQLTDLLDYNYKLCFPIKIKTISYKNFVKPWITKEILSIIKKRHDYYLLFRKKLIHKKTYTDYRNYVTNEIRNSKRKYYEKAFNEVRNNIKQTWSIINNVLKPKINRRTNIVKKLIINDVTFDDPIDISNNFNDFFVNIGKNIAESVDSNFNDHKKYLTHIDQPNSFFFKPVTTNEIKDTINSLKNKSGNINSIPTKILKSISSIICFPLTLIINNSLITGSFPDSLKKARVIPIFKEGDKTNINNYRPISILPIMSKIFEKLVYKQLYEYLEQNSFLNNYQYGFRARKSTTQAILNLLQYLYKNIDSGKIIFSIFLDFRKAFDSVNHKILLSKLETYGIRGVALDWFRSYLSNRSQYVCINDACSNVLKIDYSVPQGSILGPLLFLIFINDISKSSDFFKYILYADDSTLSTCINENEIDSFTNSINKELNNVHLWLCANKIVINEDKTKYMIFSYSKTPTLSEIKIGNNIIPITPVTKFLGVHIDSNLKFDSHMNIISKKLSKSIGLLYKLNKYLPNHVLKILYCTLIHPYLSYGLEAWYGTFKNHTSKIFILQKKAIRAINQLEYNEHTNEYFISNNILKLEDQFKLQISTYIYILLNSNYIDIEIASKLKPNIEIHDHDTRGGQKLNIMRVNKSKSKNCLFHNGVKIWNSLPDLAKNSNSILKFKKTAKKFLHEKY